MRLKKLVVFFVIYSLKVKSQFRIIRFNFKIAEFEGIFQIHDDPWCYVDVT